MTDFDNVEAASNATHWRAPSPLPSLLQNVRPQKRAQNSFAKSHRTKTGKFFTMRLNKLFTFQSSFSLPAICGDPLVLL